MSGWSSIDLASRPMVKAPSAKASPGKRRAAKHAQIHARAIIARPEYRKAILWNCIGQNDVPDKLLVVGIEAGEFLVERAVMEEVHPRVVGHHGRLGEEDLDLRADHA